MKNLLIAVVSLFTLGSLSAQSFIGKINALPSDKPLSISADDTVKILAVMVSFQEDRDGATFGNGKFGSIYTQNYGLSILDPLPHDKPYFESHLQFVKNYFEKVSDGKVSISFTVLPDTFSVSKTMRNYSPDPNSDDFTPIADFSKEVWTIADQLYPSFDFSSYDVFLIFHAGVGRDISLPGSLGNERDIPSVYLGFNSLKNIYGDSFNGFPVSNGSFNITNSMIIPETESRELETITGKFLFEITINGLIVASVASHLGLPDLFDTETGLSAIGRFGLMDGQSIFAYNGSFPPEPSAWEKIYLGWADYVEYDGIQSDINVVAKLAASIADTVILKVPINSTEYYLVENRQRDVLNDGATVTYISNGSVRTVTFPKDTTGFLSFDTDLLEGVVLNVDEFDWALPGNGILIWHIDDNVINEKLALNKINADKTRRGVDVEEADGIQDIGETFVTVFGDQVIGEGFQEDYWYSGNPAPLYKNIFSKDTRPSTLTNEGANSLITFSQFSEISNRMSFRVAYGDSIIKPLFSSSEHFPDTIRSFSVIDGNQLRFAINSNRSLVISDGNSVLETIQNFSDFKPVTMKAGSSLYVVGALITPSLSFPTKINYWFTDGTNSDSGSIDNTNRITTDPVARMTLTENYEILFGTDNGKVLTFDLLSIISGNNTPKSEEEIDQDLTINKLAFNGLEVSIIGSKLQNGVETYFLYNGSNTIRFENTEIVNLVSTLDRSGVPTSVVSGIENGISKYFVVQTDKIISSFNSPGEESLNWFSLADLKNDGSNYILTVGGNSLYAFNLNGTLADNYPQTIVNDNFKWIPLTADIEGDSRSEIIVSTENGLIYCYDGGSGQVVDGFPISTGKILASDGVLFANDGKICLSTIDDAGYLRGWQISSVISRIEWAEKNGNNFNSSFLGSAKSEKFVNEFLPANRAYNYPNPVYGSETSIRYYVNEDSKINIKIFDLAGDFVAELNDEALGGFDNETIWNVSNIQSGVYLARIEASSSSGKSESTIIKIAVIK